MAALREKTRKFLPIADGFRQPGRKRCHGRATLLIAKAAQALSSPPLDVVLEGLHDAWRTRKASMDDLWRYARNCRIASVMRP